ncbi:MAG: enoyl-CoA hydratase/isomerase family protein [Sulfobacillus sp.]
MKVEVSRTGAVETITLNRPEVLNALDQETKAAYLAALRKAARDPEVRAVVLSGSGRAFCAGEDLKSHPEGAKRSFRHSLVSGYNPIIQTIVEMDKPVIARLQGVAAGAGFSIALAADLRIGTDATRLIAAFSRIGLVPDSGLSQTLERFVGPGVALELFYTARPMEAPEAARWGILNTVVAADQLDATVASWAQDLAAGPTLAFALTKQAVRRAYQASLSDQLAYEAAAQELAGASADHREGVSAFLAKRTPRFSGR